MIVRPFVSFVSSFTSFVGSLVRSFRSVHWFVGSLVRWFVR